MYLFVVTKTPQLEPDPSWITMPTTGVSFAVTAFAGSNHSNEQTLQTALQNWPAKWTDAVVDN